MSAKLIDGKALAEKILLEVRQKVVAMENKPGLAAILVGDNEASKIYLRLKEKACIETGILFSSYILSADCEEKEILDVINFLNKDEQVNGIIVQLPLPTGFNKEKIINAIDPKKDIDGFHEKTKFTSPNVLGIIELIKATGTDLKGKKIVVFSNSEIFSQPFKKLLPKSTIEYASPQSSTDLKSADILIVAIGKAKYLRPEMIKKDAILIDVGINKVGGKTVGDIDPDCDKVASWRSPVPGGVGPMTVAMLLQNLVNQ
jgi:methylenetetrahydrofolate dehydrogenase (NADP+) / methenyltetrahydrofolate cyclohydrolase